MLTRRDFAARLTLGAAAFRMSTEMAYAQRAAVKGGELPKDMVWLNANENPAGPPAVVAGRHARGAAALRPVPLQRIRRASTSRSRRAKNSARDQIVIGAGSSEVLHTAVDVFTSPTRPLISVTPAYEGPDRDWRARSAGPSC